ncbi:MAG: prephenate dehydratase [Puniceicoccaceae bacterium]
MTESLAELRERINRIDGNLVRALNERIRLAALIGREKARAGMPVFDPAREEDVLSRATGASDGAFPAPALRRIFREIISASISLQKQLVIGFLGPESTFTHQAARECFGSSVEFRPYRTIPEIFRAVERGGVDYGVAPVENSIQGSVFATLDALVDADLRIIAERRLRIEHCLISGAKRGAIRKVYSKDQALGQCRDWLARNLPDAEYVETTSTARAVEIAAEEEGAAAIAGTLAAAEFGLPVVERGIQDSPDNHTRFFVLSRPSAAPPPPPPERARTSLVLSVADEPGALQSVLGPFAEKGINLSRIESRPSRKRAWDYLFFIEFAGHEETGDARVVIDRLRAACPFVKVLGSFPLADELD